MKYGIRYGVDERFSGALISVSFNADFPFPSKPGGGLSGTCDFAISGLSSVTVD